MRRREIGGEISTTDGRRFFLLRFFLIPAVLPFLFLIVWSACATLTPENTTWSHPRVRKIALWLALTMGTVGTPGYLVGVIFSPELSIAPKWVRAWVGASLLLIMGSWLATIVAFIPVIYFAVLGMPSVMGCLFVWLKLRANVLGKQ